MGEATEQTLSPKHGDLDLETAKSLWPDDLRSLTVWFRTGGHKYTKWQDHLVLIDKQEFGSIANRELVEGGKNLINIVPFFDLISLSMIFLTPELGDIL